MPLRRGHTRTDPRTGRLVNVRAHEVRASRAHGVAADAIDRLRSQADAGHDDDDSLGYFVPRREPGRDRRMPEDYTLVTDRLSSTGDPGPWWRANRATRADAQDAVPEMPERYSPSSSRTGRRTHRIVYGAADLQVRLPSHAAINRFSCDHPGLRSFDVPAELLRNGVRGMGTIRLTKNDETGRWEVTGGTGAYGGNGEWAERAREAVGAVVAARRPRATMAELRQASTEASRRLVGAEGGAVAGEATARLLPELTWVDVDSSALARIGYDPLTRRMEVEFHGGRRASYRNVPPADHAALLSAGSIGGHYTRNIRSNPAYMGHGSVATAPVPVEPGWPAAHAGSPTATNCPACGQFVGEEATHDCPGLSASGTAQVDAAGHATEPAVVEMGPAETPAMPEDESVLRRRRLEAGVGLDGRGGWSAARLQGNGAVLTTAGGAVVTIEGVDEARLAEFVAAPDSIALTTLGESVSLGGSARVVFTEGGPYTQAALVLGSDTERPRMIMLTAGGRIVDAPLASLSEWSVVTGGSHPNAEVAEAIGRRVPSRSHDGIDMLPLVSASLARAGYDPVAGRLRVEMHDGRGHTYEGVAPEAWRAMQHATDSDEHYRNHVAGRYEVSPDHVLLGRYAARSGGLRMLPVRSDDLYAVGYDPVAQTLLVQRAVDASGMAQVVRYTEVEPATAAAIVASDDPDRVARRLLDPARVEPVGLRGHPVGHCPGCGRFVARSGHECPGPSGALGVNFRRPAPGETGQPDWASASGVLSGARWDNGSAVLDHWTGEREVVNRVSEVEFNRLAVDPDVTYRAWCAGRRLSAEGASAPPPLRINVPDDVRAARIIHNSAFNFGVSESLRMPSVTAVRAFARSHPGERFHIPVRSVVNDDQSAESATVLLDGMLLVQRDHRDRLCAIDDGSMPTGTPEQRAMLARDVTAMLQARRVTGEFSRIREAHLAATERLRGVAEMSRLAQAAAQRRHEEREAAARSQRAQAHSNRANAVSWSADHERFQHHYEAARARRAAGEPVVPYMRENATDGLGSRHGGRGFGVEIEFDFAPGVNSQEARAAILRDLKVEGVIPERHPDRWLGYCQQRSFGYEMWKCTEDATVAGEIVSPIMYDDAESWGQLEKVCAVLRRHGATATTRTGNHVHVSCGDYDHTVENHNRLLADAESAGDVLYRLASNPERGTHRGVRWCAPNAALPVEGYRRVQDAQYSNSTHHVAVNFQSVSGNPGDHVEFRMWDSTLDPAVIQTQIKVSLGMTEAAFAGRTVEPEDREPLGTRRNANPSGRRLENEEWQAATRVFRQTLDRLFAREEDKSQATSLFAATRWQRRR